MIKRCFLFLILLYLSSCGQGGGQKKNLPIPKSENPKANNIKDTQICLEKKAGYLANPPLELIKFAEVVSRSALECKADRRDVFEYSKRIGEKYGGL